METPTYDAIIIGAGLSGLSVATFLKAEQPDISLMVLEKDDRAGGAIRSHFEEGYLAEAGAHGYLDNCEESKTLATLAGLEDEIVKAPLAKFGRYICLNGKLNLIPQKPGKIIAANLISPLAKLRVLADIYKAPLQGEPSVHDWVKYRFGKKLLPFADAVFTGTYAGDIERLKIDAVMPGLRELEDENGSIIHGLFKKMKKKNQKKKGSAKTLPAMTSFSSGMSRFPEAMAERLNKNKEIMYRTNVQSIVPGSGFWEVKTEQHSMRCRHLVLGLPTNQSLALLTPASHIPRPPLESIPEARIATIALGFTKEAEIPFGFGYLAPESENRFCLGSLFSSHMFSERAPKGHSLIEVLVGGRRHPERLNLEDGELFDKVYEDIRQLIKLPKPPCFQKILRPRAGIPQLEARYPELLKWREDVHLENESVHICGFGWKGIGINDMTKEAKKIATRVLAGISDKKEKEEVKGIYF